MSPSPDSRIGTMLGYYRLDRVAGVGGMGAVYQAYDTVKQRPVALKLLHAHFADDPSYVERFRREQHLTASLTEPHVIPIHDFGELDGELYIDMRLVEGSNLKSILRSRGAGIEPERAVSIIEQVAAALDAAHAAGLLHRDVKPENILVTPQNFTYLCDFGIAYTPDAPALTAIDTTIGSFSYMAPERFDNAEVDHRADVYSLACVLHESLTGHVPHPADSVSRAIKAHLINPPPAPSTQNPSIPTGFDGVIARGLDKDPHRRPASAGELAAQARAALTSPPPRPSTTALPQPVQTPSYSQQYQPPSTPEPMWNPGYPAAYPAAAPARRESNGTVIALALIATLLIVAIAAILVWFFGFRDTSSQTAAPSTSTQTVVTQPAPQTPAAPTQSAAGPPDGSRVCVSEPGSQFGSAAAGTSVTTCEFAVSVRDSYRTGPAADRRVIEAYSPITFRTYTMTCLRSGSTVTCSGGNNAVVYLY